MDQLRTLVKRIKRNEVTWRYVRNFGPTLRYRSADASRLTSTERDIVGRLNEDGVVTVPIGALAYPGLIDEMYRSADQLLKVRSSDTVELSRLANTDATIGRKSFNLEMLGSKLTFDVDCIWAKLAVNESFLRIANEYFRMISHLRYYNVWFTAASSSAARESQLWHFDREDEYILKLFIYLSDVDDGSGPFTYAPGTHKKGKFRSLDPGHFIEGGVRRSTDEQMRAVYPDDRWIRAIGKKGTVVLADTRGYHKGGEARESDRLMFTCMFTSPASESKRLIDYPNGLDLSGLTKLQRRALGRDLSGAAATELRVSRPGMR